MTSEKLAWTCAAVCAVLAAILWFSQTPAPPPPVPARLTFDAGVTTWPAVSADGKLVAYASDRDSGKNLDLYVQPVSGGDAVRLTHGSDDVSEPDFSPNAGTIAFRREKDGGGIWVIPTAGGEPRLLLAGGHAPRYSPDGKWVTYRAEHKALLIPTSGGTPRRVGPDQHGMATAWSPDGQWIFFGVGGVIVPAFAAGEPRRWGIAANIDDPNWTDAGLVHSGRNGWARNIYLRPLTHDGALNGGWAQLTNGTEIADHVRASKGGRIVFASSSQRFNFFALPIDANSAKVTGPITRLTDGFRPVEFPKTPAPSHISPNGKWTYSLVCRETRCSIQATPTSGSPITIYDADTPRLSIAGVNPQVRDLSVERDRIVMILAEQTSNIWIMDLIR